MSVGILPLSRLDSPHLISVGQVANMGSLVSKNSGNWPVLVQMFPPKPKFSVDQIPDLTGKVTIVTGAYLVQLSARSLRLVEYSSIPRRECWDRIRDSEGESNISADVVQDSQ